MPAILLACARLFSIPAFAQTNSTQHTPQPHRVLIIVDTSRSMQNRSQATLQAVQALLDSGMRGQLREHDTLGLWTFNHELYTGRFPLQQWYLQAPKTVTPRVLAFLKEQKYQNRANLNAILPALNRVIKDSSFLTIVLISSGETKIQGTPFDDRINDFYQKWQKEQQKARMPFLTVLRAQDGRLTKCTVNQAPWPPELPDMPPETKAAELTQNKLRDAPRQAPPLTNAPLIISGKKPMLDQPTNSAAPVATVLEPPGARSATPISSNAPKTDLANGPGPKPTEPVAVSKIDVPQPAPMPNAAATVPAPAPAVVNGAPTNAPRTTAAGVGPLPAGVALASVAPRAITAAIDSSSTAAPTTKAETSPAPPAPAPQPAAPPLATAGVQNAAAVPPGAIISRKTLWAVGLVLAAAAAALGLLLKRRSRPPARVSLITRSLEQEKKR